MHVEIAQLREPHEPASGRRRAQGVAGRLQPARLADDPARGERREACSGGREDPAS